MFISTCIVVGAVLLGSVLSEDAGGPDADEASKKVPLYQVCDILIFLVSDSLPKFTLPLILSLKLHSVVVHSVYA